MRRRARSLIGTLFLLTSFVTGATPAFASFTSVPSAPSMTIASATLVAPTGTSASNSGCIVSSSTKVKVTWTASTSTFADGYQVLRSTTNGGPYSVVGTVSGLNTTSFTDSSVAFLTTYYYVVRATKLNWTSTNSNQASITTLTSLCL
jgi:hypothetical protein